MGKSSDEESSRSAVQTATAETGVPFASLVGIGGRAIVPAGTSDVADPSVGRDAREQRVDDTLHAPAATIASAHETSHGNRTTPVSTAQVLAGVVLSGALPVFAYAAAYAREAALLTSLGMPTDHISLGPDMLYTLVQLLVGVILLAYGAALVLSTAVPYMVLATVSAWVLLLDSWRRYRSVTETVDWWRASAGVTLMVLVVAWLVVRVRRARMKDQGTKTSMAQTTSESSTVAHGSWVERIARRLGDHVDEVHGAIGMYGRAALAGVAGLVPAMLCLGYSGARVGDGMRQGAGAWHTSIDGIDWIRFRRYGERTVLVASPIPRSGRVVSYRVIDAGEESKHVWSWRNASEVPKGAASDAGRTAP